MSYIGTEPKDIRSFGRTKFDYTASQGQTAFTGADDDGKVLAFTVGQIEVYVNGILMDDSDFTTTGTGTVTLASAANLNDVINIVSFESNIPDNDYVPASGGTFTGAVTHSGNVSVGGTLGVTGAVTASNGLTVDDDGATVLTVDRATSDGDIIDIQRGGTSAGKIGGTSNVLSIVGKDGDGGIAIQNNSYGDIIYPASNSSGGASDNAIDLGYNNGRWRNLYLSSGIYLGGTGAANHLDDYEEGTWSGSVGAVQGSTQPTVSGGTFTGTYTKIGKVVHVSFYAGPFQFSGALTSTLAIKGMPFAHGGGDSTNGGVTSTYYITWARPDYVALRVYSGNEAAFLSVNNGANWGWEACSAAGTGSSRYISGTLQYTVA